MVQGASEIAALCVGLVGLIGAAAATGMPMWKVTAFIGENIIVMETRWEGLWMNCYRQANIRMQCKVYDSLLYLPPDLQAARGLMCCSVALAGLALLGALAGMRCISCIQDNDHAKTCILMVAGMMQFLASLCVFIPVSWTAHVIIQDFYNPLLIDAQRRELGEALYIGWVTGAFLFASGILFVCRHVPSDKASLDICHPANRLNKPTMMRYRPISQSHSIDGRQLHNRQDLSPPNLPYGPGGVVLNTPAAVYDSRMVESMGPLVYQPCSLGGQPTFSSQSSNYISSLSTHGNSSRVLLQNPYSGNQQTIAPSTANTASRHPSAYSFNRPGSTSASHNTSLRAVPRNPVFIRYERSTAKPPQSYHSGSSVGVYI
ncbi:claudin-8 [Esox lucius]|uniref:Claudin n=1 Tax=Esox lucius TaxID=8010 RepID=A0AAY5KYX9_ESOLU|nr:claudin-8 [Esox lucius]